METPKVPDTFGNTFLGIIIGIILLQLLFDGDPDMSDAIRTLVLRYAGLE